MLYISSEFPPGPGGIGQHTASLLKALPENQKVDLLTNQDYCMQEEADLYNSKELKARQAIHFFTSREKKLYSLRRFWQAMRLVRRTRPDKVIVSGRFPLWVGGGLKLLFPKLQIEGFVHGTEITPKGNWEDKINRWALHKFDRIYPVSSFTAGFLPIELDKEKIKVISNGLDRRWLDEASVYSGNKFDVKGQPSLLTVGNVTFRKGQQRVIKALPAIRKLFPDVHYHIVGLPTKKSEMETLAKSLGVHEAITFHGRVERERLYDFYGNCDIFVMLSENQSDGDVEGFGIAILEANAFGVPAIGASGCGIEDAIHTKSGKLVDGDKVNEIAVAVKDLMWEKEAFRKGARAWAEQHSWENIVKKMDL